VEKLTREEEGKKAAIDFQSDTVGFDVNVAKRVSHGAKEAAFRLGEEIQDWENDCLLGCVPAVFPAWIMADACGESA
jgi:hypothetical protein